MPYLAAACLKIDACLWFVGLFCEDWLPEAFLSAAWAVLLRVSVKKTTMETITKACRGERFVILSSESMEVYVSIYQVMVK